MASEPLGHVKHRDQRWSNASMLAGAGSVLCAIGMVAMIFGTIFAARVRVDYGYYVWDQVTLFLGLGVMAVLLIGTLLCAVAALACKALAEDRLRDR